MSYARIIGRRIVKELRGIIIKLLRYLLRSLTKHRVLGGVMTQVRTSPMVLIAPGSSPKFGVTPLPVDVVTVAAQTAWTSSDPINAPVTVDASDATGLTATVALSESIAVGSEVTLLWTYTNADGTTAAVTGTFPVVAVATPPVTDVTGGTMAQIA